MRAPASIDAAAIPPRLPVPARPSGRAATAPFPQILARDFSPPRGHAKQLGKDLLAVAEFTEKLGLTLPVVAAAISQYRGYVDAGNGMQDSASVARLYVGDERQE